MSVPQNGCGYKSVNQEIGDKKLRGKEVLSALSGKLEIKSREEISQKFLKGNWASVTKMAAN